ncbi:FkbM family methyltransferase [Xanthocytophaga agilis]|uniref:FkbM family methyltransferase n=1 Tax=Xanthocytophaga agilis TaxID=3048010 RepID=A0AAE3R7E5_9BACT|nr:FkbM family methyltransferase [Xanthocytophaga agilis]MDJ1502178.1 FkbM family methyltransferase [Xanthocytophaga agilis]
MINKIKKHINKKILYLLSPIIYKNPLIVKNILKSDTASFVLDTIKKDSNLLDLVLQEFKEEIHTRMENYPSPLNPGYNHIDKSVEILKRTTGNQADLLIVDIGAATGYVSELFAKTLPEHTIYSFEPIKNSYEQLKNKSEFYKNIIPRNKAIGSSNTELEINVANRITASSLYALNPGEDNNFITQNINLTRKETITVSTLDTEISIGQRIGILKLDVQGYELEALKGAYRCLEETYIILVEVSNHNYYTGGAQYYEIDDFLRKKGFRLYTIIPSLRENGRMLEWDCIYTNQKFVKL